LTPCDAREPEKIGKKNASLLKSRQILCYFPARLAIARGRSPFRRRDLSLT
jgi:hypothetical protein